MSGPLHVIARVDKITFIYEYDNIACRHTYNHICCSPPIHPDKKIGHINSFFELEAQDIDEHILKFDQFKGQVTVITNVASYCGYTESHYRGLNKLYKKFKGSRIPLNILAFPCNQFGEQE